MVKLATKKEKQRAIAINCNFMPQYIFKWTSQGLKSAEK